MLDSGALPIDPSKLDVAPFGLPNCAPGEVRFEEPREVATVVARFCGGVPMGARLEYLRKYWPEGHWLRIDPFEDPCWYGWMPVDDSFNSAWQTAATDIEVCGDTVIFTMRDLREELPEAGEEVVLYRKTLGLRIACPTPTDLAEVKVYTTATASQRELIVSLDQGRPTSESSFGAEGYNAHVVSVTPLDDRSFRLQAICMKPARWDSGDDSLITIDLGDERLTMSVVSLDRDGPIWVEHRGLYVRREGDPTTFAEYKSTWENRKTLNAQVAEHVEQSFAGATNGQPRPHPVSTNIGRPHSRHRFRVEPNADLVLEKHNVESVPAGDTARFKCEGAARFFFGLEQWRALGRYPDPAPVMAHNHLFRRGDLDLRVRSFAWPLNSECHADAALRGDETTVAMVRFSFVNTGETPCLAEFRIRYSDKSRRSENAYDQALQDDWLVPESEPTNLSIQGDRLYTSYQGTPVCRALLKGVGEGSKEDAGVRFSRTLQPGEPWEAVILVPFVEPTPGELDVLRGLDYVSCDQASASFWRRWCSAGAQVATPVPQLNDLHLSHVAHVGMTDFEMPDGSGWINTSVGTSTYGNYSNESCMIVHDLDERGFHEAAQRRLDLWVKYQGTVPQPGNFTDCDGMFYGAGGFEHGAYNQHHGWVLWALAEHYLVTRDDAWLDRTAGALVAGADWVFRQRAGTMSALPHSRGWERGFLPAGSLEDVTDFHYWLSTNAVTWRGTDAVAEALSAGDRPEADRIRRESDAYGEDLRKGFETMRQMSPVVRLRDGRWVPHYPSRVYRRGRDVGWIRETLEGAFFLPACGLYSADEPEASWILDDYQDNRYPKPPYGYLLPDFEHNWFDRAGFSIQPLLPAGLLPHLDRDEPEIFLWMYFNALAACYRSEINAVAEHPAPVLGYSNEAAFKTSDESNATSWLRAMFVYARGGLLHLGRAVPRKWMGSKGTIGLRGAATRFGKVSVAFEMKPNRLVATVALTLHTCPRQILVRFRHPYGRRIVAASVDGQPAAVMPSGEDVVLPLQTGTCVVEARYEIEVA